MPKYKQLLDFPHTCPKIDNEISYCKDTIENNVVSLLSEYIDDEDELYKVAKQFTKDLYNEISEIFETVRSTNEDMRDTANQQLSDLENTISDLQDTIKKLEYELDN